MDEKTIENFIFEQALENAVNFEGKANPKAVFGKTISQFPEIKEDINHFRNVINNIITQVNNMPIKEQTQKLSALKPDFSKEKKKIKDEKKNGLIDLPGHSGPFIGRIAPAPSGYLHIGHLKNLVFNSEYKKKYGGKFIVRFEDTNPEKIAIENYESILNDIKWITDNNIDEIYYQSDRLDIYYKYLRQLIETGYAYVCECSQDTFKAFNDAGEPCPHREMEIEKQINHFNNFFNNTYKDGDACIRFKGDLKNKNPALRDFPIARMNSTPHARVGTKYKLWPMYNFAAALDDGLMGINYIIRGKDSEINGIRQDMIKDAIGLEKCPYYHYGMINFTDIELGKTPIKKKVDAGIYTGFDDPRVPTVISFRKRGFKAEAFRNLIISMGMSKRDSKISEKEYFKLINYHNKQILEKEANRFFFVVNPKVLKIVNHKEFPEKEIELAKHPDFKERGYRKFLIKDKYYIDGIDFKALNKNDTFRLMHFGNFKVIDKTDRLEVKFISKEYDKSLETKRNIHYVPYYKGENKNVEIIMQDAQKLKGLAEDLDNPKPDTAVQFERFGFARFDNLDENGTYHFYFTHR